MATPEAMAESMVRNLKEKTGRTLEEWKQVVQASQLTKHGEIVKHLKEVHGIGHGFANTIVHLSLAGPEPVSDDALVNVQYAGPKAALRPLYDKLLALVKPFGEDVVISPKKTYVSLRRSKQFALIQPTTATRVDVGINLKGVPSTKRLEASGSFNAMVSHRVRVEKAEQIDAELKKWLHQAYKSA